MIIDGKAIAAEIITELKSLPKPKKFIAAMLVGEDAASLSFLKQKEKVAKELDVDFRLYEFPGAISQDDLREEVRKIGAHKTCGGVIVQLPLPDHVSPQYVLNVIPREKDIDVLGERALGAFYASRNPVLPPAVAAVEAILKTQNFKLETASVAVIGLGFLVGRPISLWLERMCRNLYLLRRGSDMTILKKADLVITGAGSPHLINAEMLKDGALVIDFGYGLLDSKIVGDFDPGELLNQSTGKLVNWTPTPAGTGPVLVVTLVRNFYILNRDY